MITRIALAGLFGLAALSAVSTAQASPLLALGDDVHVTGETETTGDTATISFAHLPGSSTQNVNTAPVLLSGSFGQANTAFSMLLAYCTDLYHYSATPADYTVRLLTSSNQPNGNPALSTTQLNNIASLISNAGNTDQAATQLAIWSVEYGDAFSFTNASGSTAADEASYVGRLTGQAPPGIAVYQLQSPAAQGFAIAEPVPEPASILLLGVGMVGAGVVARRRRSTTAVS